MNAATKRMVTGLNDRGEDFEWYPSTPEIIKTIKMDMELNELDNPSILDCGAGDGRVLNALTDGRKYAIEKSRPLLNALNKDIFIVGTEFEEQTLIDKKVKIVFSNPPYSQFTAWASKIIREANASYIYLVMPSRWQDSVEIMDLIKLRKADFKILGSFDFLNADRQARAKVDIVRISLIHEGHHNKDYQKVDAFTLWFEDNFKLEINKTESSKYASKLSMDETLDDHVANELVNGGSLISVLEEFYQRDLNKLISTYQGLCSVDASILMELDVNIDAVRKALAEKIENLKDRYWHQLFNKLTAITDKLTASSRSSLLKTLTAHTHVDFTSSNAHAVVLWVIKNANDFFESQIIRMVESMTEKATVQGYKSNKRAFEAEDWRYCRRPENLSFYQLDYRIVLEHVGGLNSSTWQHDSINGLSSRAATFIDDLCTIAGNLGYDTYGLSRAGDFEWGSGKKHILEYRKIGQGNDTLFDVRAFKNQNLHIRFNSSFIMRLNVEFGRLKGWLKTKEEAADELDISVDEVGQAFGCNYQLTNDSILKLGFGG